jgi:hypothetical protein
LFLSSDWHLGFDDTSASFCCLSKLLIHSWGFMPLPALLVFLFTYIRNCLYHWIPSIEIQRAVFVFLIRNQTGRGCFYLSSSQINNWKELFEDGTISGFFHYL